MDKPEPTRSQQIAGGKQFRASTDGPSARSVTVVQTAKLQSTNVKVTEVLSKVVDDGWVRRRTLGVLLLSTRMPTRHWSTPP